MVSRKSSGSGSARPGSEWKNAENKPKTVGGSSVAGVAGLTPGTITVPMFGEGQYQSGPLTQGEHSGGYIPKQVLTGYSDLSVASASDLRSIFDTMEYNQDPRLNQFMQAFGLSDVKSARSLWYKAANYAASLAKGGNAVDFFDVINSKAFQSQYSGGSSLATSVQEQVRQWDDQTASSLINSVYMQTLGRMATDDEVSSLVANLNAGEMANPTVSTTTSVGGKVRTVSKGGFDQQAFVAEKAKAAPDYEKYQNTQFGDWLMGALAGQNVTGA